MSALHDSALLPDKAEPVVYFKFTLIYNSFLFCPLAENVSVEY